MDSKITSTNVEWTIWDSSEHKHLIWEWFQLRDNYIWIIDDVESGHDTVTIRLCAFGYIYEVVI